MTTMEDRLRRDPPEPDAVLDLREQLSAERERAEKWKRIADQQHNAVIECTCTIADLGGFTQDPPQPGSKMVVTSTAGMEMSPADVALELQETRGDLIETYYHNARLEEERDAANRRAERAEAEVADWEHLNEQRWTKPQAEVEALKAEVARHCKTIRMMRRHSHGHETIGKLRDEIDMLDRLLAKGAELRGEIKEPVSVDEAVDHVIGQTLELAHSADRVDLAAERERAQEAEDRTVELECSLVTAYADRDAANERAAVGAECPAWASKDGTAVLLEIDSYTELIKKCSGLRVGLKELAEAMDPSLVRVMMRSSDCTDCGTERFYEGMAHRCRWYEARTLRHIPGRRLPNIIGGCRGGSLHACCACLCGGMGE